MDFLKNDSCITLKKLKLKLKKKVWDAQEATGDSADLGGAGQLLTFTLGDG